ncbi:5'-methylthioadenosine/adenosylhomocysteine nucleosidase [Francisella tularensis subsp. novicida]|uniref:5'-methylthioadenosine/adenosylhomocysteine nucleosidase n=1 Tax=Francisella tularensis TaxID=263 RepID=UPI000158ADDA|nr:5'-methylthioadenosine/adenosylhomocysteine nucleosidase [Francisella tularensis]AJI46194.1 MTA/SAH nucleosidase [Francisella tularensis subsp. novicida F6168]AJJ46383.1 MTA/SAH nucleosidase [Francisella tularensis subsp. novicida]APC98860.1 MTA/SAH nucleosidase [Francisella tularensis subsp. novicida]EDN35839.1 5'-methylthioadenosine\S-adenosylhomocysteine nucleosidase [Francisella tularensis subsp. novicida GA99-3549]KFJ67398.1 MTA/SAH nucleosidase [Francisella tularensis subsp. novicida]
MRKIAILGAMEIEIQPILDKLNSYETIEYANNKYYLANYQDKELVIAYSKIGKVFSSLTATIMIERFGVEALLFSGVAGGLQDLKVGDMIAATATVQHDVDITAFGYPYGKIPISEVEIKTSAKLLKQAQNVANKLGLKLHTGVIATGDQFVHCAERKDFVIKEFAAKAIEMEGASVNLICNEMGVPSLILRSISDTADGNAPENFDEFAKMAAKRSANFIMQILSNI